MQFGLASHWPLEQSLSCREDSYSTLLQNSIPDAVESVVDTDGDGDGVIDNADQCKSTKAGVLVDVSDRRAKMVVEYLGYKGVRTENLIPTAFGETKPIDSNDTSEGRARNRRVELQAFK